MLGALLFISSCLHPHAQKVLQQSHLEKAALEEKAETSVNHNVMWPNKTSLISVNGESLPLALIMFIIGIIFFTAYSFCMLNPQLSAINSFWEEKEIAKLKQK